jgi:hypothetical protein
MGTVEIESEGTARRREANPTLVSGLSWKPTLPMKLWKDGAPFQWRGKGGPAAHRGQCSATITADYSLNREELVSLLDFMQEHERAH